MNDRIGYLKDEVGEPMSLPPIIYGAGTFSNQYNTDDHLASTIPLRTVRLALRYLHHVPVND